MKHEIKIANVPEAIKKFIRKQQRKEVIRQEDEEDSKFRRRIVK